MNAFQFVATLRESAVWALTVRYEGVLGVVRAVGNTDLQACNDARAAYPWMDAGLIISAKRV